MGRRCTVTVVETDGRRYSLDVHASSSFDAAHLYAAHVLRNPTCGYPMATTATPFDVVAQDKLIVVTGVKLKAWIEKRREEWKGPRGLLFRERPILMD